MSKKDISIPEYPKDYAINLKKKRIRHYLQMCKFRHLGIFVPITYKNIAKSMI